MDTAGTLHLYQLGVEHYAGGKFTAVGINVEQVRPGGRLIIGLGNCACGYIRAKFSQCSSTPPGELPAGTVKKPGTEKGRNRNGPHTHAK